jgi:hypothetical protein
MIRALIVTLVFVHLHAVDCAGQSAIPGFAQMVPDSGASVRVSVLSSRVVGIMQARRADSLLSVGSWAWNEQRSQDRRALRPGGRSPFRGSSWKQ